MYSLSFPSAAGASTTSGEHDIKDVSIDIPRHADGDCRSPMRLGIARYGPVTIFAVRTPDGAILEFYESSR